jgi:hypothetical protein
LNWAKTVDVEDMDDEELTLANVGKDVTDFMTPSHLISESVPHEEVMATTSKHARSSRKGASWVWTYFYKPASGSIHCICKLCNAKVNYSLTKSTGALSRHIKKFIYLSGKSAFMQKLRLPFLLLLVLSLPRAQHQLNPTSNIAPTSKNVS